MKKLVTLFTILTVSGCAQTMSDSQYQGFANHWVGLHQCFDSGEIDPSLYANAKTSYLYFLKQFSYDSGKLSKAIDDSTNYSSQDCRSIAANSHRMISDLNTNQKAWKEASTSWDDAIESLNESNSKRKMTYCNSTITGTGASTTCW